MKKGLEGDGGSRSGKTYDYGPDRDHKSKPLRPVSHEKSRGDDTRAAASTSSNEPPRVEKREKTPEQIAAIQEKKRKLLSKYG